MPPAFRFVALPAEQFTPPFSLSDEELRALDARRVIVDEKPGFPCRVSLTDAEVDEIVLLLPFTHHDVASPYRASGPIYVRPRVAQATPAVGEVPAMLLQRLLSLRAYDREAMLVDARVVQGREIEGAIVEAFSRSSIRYLQVHNAGPGCFNCSVVRAA